MCSNPSGTKDRINSTLASTSNGFGLASELRAQGDFLFGFLTQMYARFWNDLADHASA